ncbi:MAG: hypothetical protein WKF57_06685 [Nakamurella sp.]
MSSEDPKANSKSDSVPHMVVPDDRDDDTYYFRSKEAAEAFLDTLWVNPFLMKPPPPTTTYRQMKFQTWPIPFEEL